jgi:tetratricopeptide (TPR) repeat protein
VRVDLFALRKGGTIEGELLAPLRPELPELVPGESYLVDTVVRTLKLGHPFTQGTADSNETWLDITVKSGEHVIGRSGGQAEDGEVDPWSHFLNAYVLDREGKRIDRRNAQDIFVPLYDHQIPPGAADVVHYRFEVPEDVREVTIEAALHYRKFDTTYVKLFQKEEFDGNDLPVMTIARDSITLPVRGGTSAAAQECTIAPWERWNDYGIGLLRKSGASGAAGEMRQAEEAFRRVEELARPDGPLNLGRVYLREGRLEEAAAALQRAAKHDPPAPAWSIAWFSGLIDKQNGYLDEAIANFESILALDTEETRKREFDFSQDYMLLTELGQTLYERAKEERGDGRRAAREVLLEKSRGHYERALELDPENLSAHYNLSLILAELGDSAGSEEHRKLHEKYKPDDNARDKAIARARLDNPAANHAAEAVVIYDLQRSGTYGLPADEATSDGHAPSGSGSR